MTDKTKTTELSELTISTSSSSDSITKQESMTVTIRGKTLREAYEYYSKLRESI